MVVVDTIKPLHYSQDEEDSKSSGSWITGSYHPGTVFKYNLIVLGNIILFWFEHNFDRPGMRTTESSDELEQMGISRGNLYYCFFILGHILGDYFVK